MKRDSNTSNDPARPKVDPAIQRSRANAGIDGVKAKAQRDVTNRMQRSSRRQSRGR